MLQFHQLMLCVAMLAAALCGFAGETAAATKPVLILFSTPMSKQWNLDFYSGFVDTAGPQTPVDIVPLEYNLSMPDSIRRMQPFIEHLSSGRYGSVIALGPRAQVLISELRASVASGTRLFFGGRIHSDSMCKKNFPGSSCFFYRQDIGRSFHLIFSLYPQTRYLVFVIGSGPEQLRQEMEIKSELKHYPLVRALFLTPNRFSSSSMLQTISDLPEKRAAVVFCSWNPGPKDASPEMYRNIARRVSSLANVPVFSISEVQQGFLGGISGYSYAYGVQMAEKVAQSASLPPEKALSDSFFTPPLTVDYEVLKQLGTYNSIPPDTVLLHRPLPVWKQSPVLFFSLLSLVFVIGALCVFLLVYIIRYRGMIGERLLSNSINKALLKSTPINYYVVDVSGSIYYSAKGLGKEHILDNITAFLPEKCHRTLLFMIKEAFVHPQSEHIFETELPDGRTIKVVIKMLVNQEFAVVTIVDISELKSYREQHADVAARLRATLESIREIVIVTDAQDNIVLFNREASLATGLSEADIGGHKFHDFFDLLDYSASIAKSIPVFSQERRERYYCFPPQTNFAIRGGHVLHIAGSATPVRDKNGTPSGIVFSFHDMTREYEERDRIEVERFLIHRSSQIADISFFEWVDGAYVHLAGENLWPHKFGEPVDYKEWILPIDQDRYRNEFSAFAADPGQATFSSVYQCGTRQSPRFFAIFLNRHADFLNRLGKPRIFGVIQDITAVQQVNLRNQELSSIMLNILNNLPGAISIKDVSRNYRFVRVNKEFCRLLGLSEEQILDQTLFDLFPYDSAAAILEFERKIQLDSGVVSRIENRVIQGRTHYFQSARIRIRIANDKDYLIGISFDITELRESRDLLHKSNVMLQTLLDNLPLAILVKDPAHDFRYLSWNRRAEQDWKVPASVAIGKTLRELPGFGFSDADIEAIQKDDASLTPEAPDARSIRTLENAAGEVRHYELWRKLIRISESESSIVIIALDITQRLQDERKLRNALENAQSSERAKSYFLASMSHEIRTPLNAVIGFSELLQDKSLPWEQRLTYLQSINNSGKVLLNLTNDILDLSKLEAEQMNIIPVPTDLKAVCSEIFSIFLHQAAQKKIELVIDSPEQIPTFFLDQIRLRQILLNLVGNAVKFTSQGSVRIIVRWLPPADGATHLTISVQDTGIGIAPAYLGKIFDPFVQDDSTPARYHASASSGTGLGLSIARRLAERMAGSLSVTSTLGKGSCFVIDFPAAKISESFPVAEPAVPHPEVIPLDTDWNILVVDDVPVNLKVVSAMLTKMKIRHHTVSSGSEALTLLDSPSNPFNLVLTDMWMPRMNGEQLARAIRRLPSCARIYVVALSADMEVAANFSVDLFDGVLDKPVSIAKLTTVLQKLSR